MASPSSSNPSTKLVLPLEAGTVNLRTGPEGADMFLDTDNSRELTFNQSGVVRVVATLTGTQTLTNKTIASSTATPFVAGVAAGYKVARSAAPVALDGSNPTSVAHGLTSCLSATVQLVGSAAPGAGTSVLTAVINGANIDVYAWKPTTGGVAGNADLVASTGTETFNWIAVGT